MSSYSKEINHAYWAILGPAEWFCVCAPRIYIVAPAPELEGWTASWIDFRGGDVTAERVMVGDAEGVNTVFETRADAARECMVQAGVAPDCTHSFDIADLKAANVEHKTAEVDCRLAAAYLFGPQEYHEPAGRAEIERQIDLWARDGWTVGGVLGVPINQPVHERLGTALVQLGRVKRSAA